MSLNHRKSMLPSWIQHLSTLFSSSFAILYYLADIYLQASQIQFSIQASKCRPNYRVVIYMKVFRCNTIGYETPSTVSGQDSLTTRHFYNSRLCPDISVRLLISDHDF